jgi:excisionase family DNA binding protein
MGMEAVAERSRQGVFVKDRLLMVAQVAKRLTVSKSTVYRMIDSGKLPSVRVGPVYGVRVRESSVEAFLEERECEKF